jgi:hypothetical protein
LKSNKGREKKRKKERIKKINKSDKTLDKKVDAQCVTEELYCSYSRPWKPIWPAATKYVCDSLREAIE